MYEDPGIYSSKWETADAAIHRTTWVSPENSLKSLIVKYEYNNDTLSQRVYMPLSKDASHLSYYTYSLDDSGRIIRETGEGGFVENIYDEAGNLKERRQYRDGKLVALKTFTFDDHPNPFIVFKCTAIPGRYTNANNILSETQITYDNEGAVETDLTESYSYDYNLTGYPVKRNDKVTYEYK
jgi:YD repeat-containing protein